MLSILRLFVLFVSATVCHWVFASLFARWGFSVNSMLVFVVAFCALLRPGIAYPMAFVCGLFLDFFGTKLFGSNAFTFTLCACIFCNMAQRVDFEHPFPQMVAVGGSVWLVAVCNAGLMMLFAAGGSWMGFGSLTGGCIVDVLLAPFVFWFVRKMLGSSPLGRQE